MSKACLFITFHSVHMDLRVHLLCSCFVGQNKSLFTFSRRDICLIGNFVEENWRPRRTREECCFFTSKCFHSLNKFNKTSFDWQEGALPQCLLFALTFLVSSCAPFWMRPKIVRRTHAHTNAPSAWNKWDFYTSLRQFECATQDTFNKCYVVSSRGSYI